jgi:hypothetical protein
MLKFYINSLDYMAVDFNSQLASADLLEMQMDIVTDTIISTPELYA